MDEYDFPLPTQSEAELLAARAALSAIKPKKYRRVKRKPKEVEPDPALEESFEIEGVVRVTLEEHIQKILECSLGENVTLENPWAYVAKELFDDLIETEFVEFKEQITNFPLDYFLLGYIPDDERETDEYYMCLTEESTNNVETIINRIEERRNENLQKSLTRYPRPWRTHGSQDEVKLLIYKNNRPLLLMELETDYPINQAKRKFKYRFSHDAQDGYVELISSRTTFYNLHKKRVDACVQVSPVVVSNEAQTNYSYPKHTFTQYHYDPELEPLDEKALLRLDKFIATSSDELDDTIYVNGFIDFYKNDYSSLVRDEKYTIPRNQAIIKPYSGFMDTDQCIGKQIISVAYHPMWTGTLAVAYSEYATPSLKKVGHGGDKVLEAIYHTMPVLLWSFKDHLNAILILETPREVSTLSFCPYDENILIGGCVNGQMIIWDIQDKLKGVEEEEILTEDQRRYRLLMFSLMKWMKNIKDLKVVRPTAVSSFEYSHSSMVTSIKWLSANREITKSGQLKDVPDEEERTSLQFMTSSTDGTVLVWDLNAKPTTAGTSFRPKRRLKRLKKRPSALTLHESPLKIFNRILKPIFKVNVMAPNTTRNLPLLHVNFRSTKPQYVERHPDSNRKFNVADRILYDVAYRNPTHPLVSQFVACSTEGDVLVGTWEGFAFNSGEIVNKETCKLENFAKYHDGPVVSLARSELFHNLILSVGGSVFALWRTDFIGKPFFWRRSKVRYTHGTFNIYRPSVFRLSTSDGYIELWHLSTRSDTYINTVRVSGSGVTGTYTHPLPLKQNVMACADSRGVLSLFFLATVVDPMNPSDKSSTYKFSQREIERKAIIAKWQEQWVANNTDLIKESAGDVEEEKTAKKSEPEKVVVASEKPPDPGLYAEKVRQEMIHRETERVRRIILSKKLLDMDVLKRQQIPLLKQEEETRKLKEKQIKRLEDSGDIFKETISMLFPEALVEEEKPIPDPYAGGDTIDIKMEYFRDYKSTETDCDKYIPKHPHTYTFDWLEIIKAGKERRQFLSYGPRRKIRPFKKNEIVPEVIEVVSVASSDSIVYADFPAEE